MENITTVYCELDFGVTNKDWGGYEQALQGRECLFIVYLSLTYGFGGDYEKEHPPIQIIKDGVSEWISKKCEEYFESS